MELRVDGSQLKTVACGAEGEGEALALVSVHGVSAGRHTLEAALRGPGGGQLAAARSRFGYALSYSRDGRCLPVGAPFSRDASQHSSVAERDRLSVTPRKRAARRDGQE